MAYTIIGDYFIYDAAGAERLPPQREWELRCWVPEPTTKGDQTRAVVATLFASVDGERHEVRAQLAFDTNLTPQMLQGMERTMRMTLTERVRRSA